MNILRILFVILLISSYLVNASFAKAADLEIICSQDKCSKSTNQPLFSLNDGLWFPGKSISKIISLKSGSNLEQEVNLQNIKNRQQESLGKVLYISFINIKNQRVVWQGSLSSLNNKKSIPLGKIKVDENLDVRVTLTMSNNASLEYQSQKAVFDLTFNFYSDKKDSQERPKSRGHVLGQSVEDFSNQSWISNFSQMIRNLFLKILSMFSFLN